MVLRSQISYHHCSNVLFPYFPFKSSTISVTHGIAKRYFHDIYSIKIATKKIGTTCTDYSKAIVALFNLSIYLI